MDPIHSTLIRFMYKFNVAVSRIIPSPPEPISGDWTSVGGGHAGSGISYASDGSMSVPSWHRLLEAPFYRVFYIESAYYAFVGPLMMLCASLFGYAGVVITIQSVYRYRRERITIKVSKGIAAQMVALPIVFAVFVLLRLLWMGEAIDPGGYIDIVGMSWVGLYGIQAAATCTILCAGLIRAGPVRTHSTGACAACGYCMDSQPKCPECGSTRDYQRPIIRARWLAIACGLLWLSPIWLPWAWAFLQR